VGKPSGRSGPLTYDELKGKARLRKGEPARPLPWFAYLVTGNLSKAAGRVAEQRLRLSARTLPSNLTLDELLHDWSFKGILRRVIRLPKCRSCHSQHWIRRLDLDRQAKCPDCGYPLELPDKVQLGYELNPIVRKALDEGITPVLKTARVLKSLTQRGFLWLPGIKGEIARKKGEIAGKKIDIDIVASCDGVLAFAECKTTIPEPRRKGDRPEVLDQLERLSELAQRCGARLVVLSADVSKIHRSIIRGVKKICRSHPQLTFLVLTSGDLERGFLLKEDACGNKQPIDIDTLLTKRLIVEPLD